MSLRYFSALAPALTALLIWAAFSTLLASTPVSATPPGSAEQSAYDVIVVGSEPEGVIAAVAAAQEGAATMLVTADERLGGLFVLGQLNVLDLSDPHQQGLFKDWWERVGAGHAFDVERSEQAFEEMLSEAGVSIRRGATDISPLLDGHQVVGVMVDNRPVAAAQVIDATAEADFAAAAGAQFSIGFESLGVAARMADTLVFRVADVDWQSLRDEVRARGPTYAQIDARVAWGHFGRYPAAYQPREAGLRMRGLNVGRQGDGTVLINALLVYGVDPLSTQSRREGVMRAAREVPRLIEYLRDLPGFEHARLAGTADRLYVRESRHLHAACQLTVDDVLDNRVTSSAVAAGGYPLDVQTLTPEDHGFVYGVPEVYGVELCVTVPRGVGGLWVVGKAAGYDPLAASSARVVPLGMAVAEAAGVAAAWAARDGSSPEAFATNDASIMRLRERLAERGAYLPPVAPRAPVGPHGSPHYDSYRLLLRRGLAVGGYDNDPRLNEPMITAALVNLLSNVAERFWNDHELAARLSAMRLTAQKPLTTARALAVTGAAVCHATPSLTAESCQAATEQLLTAAGDEELEALTRGQMYDLAAAMILKKHAD